mgnify:CR=1 FL=1
MRAAPSFGPALLEEEGQEERFRSIEVGAVRSLFPHPSPGSCSSVLVDVICFMDVLICFMALEICLQVKGFVGDDQLGEALDQRMHRQDHRRHRQGPLHRHHHALPQRKPSSLTLSAATQL